jgi:hypothetical protein
MSTNAHAIRFWQFQLPKRGEKAEDFEDASAGDAGRGRFAIADGASGSSFSALWAQLLVEEFVRSTKAHPGPWADWLPNVQKRWSAAINNRPGGKASAPWFVEDRIQQGAFAAFLGLVIEEVATWRGGQRKRWRALAVGDSCLFQVRDGKLVQSVPLARSKDFGNTPWLVGSRTILDKKFNQQAGLWKGEWRGDDRLWLMTDALSMWFLQQIEGGRKPWKELDRLLTMADPQQAFSSWIGQLRKDELIRNDDVTLLGVFL